MKTITSERDRHASDKLELVSKAAALSKERESLRAKLAAATTEVESLRGQLDEATAGRAAELKAARAEILDLQERLRVSTLERDHHASEKVELISKADAFSKECESLRAKFAATTVERDQYAAERNGAAETIARLENQIATTPSADPMVVVIDYASEKTKAFVARIRAAIPPDSPALPWFDRTISALITAGQITANAIRETIRWLAPLIKEACAWGAARARKLYAITKTQIEYWLAKRQ